MGYNATMSSISVQEIETNPADFVRRIEGGETLLVVRDKQPLAEVKPLAHRNGQPRPYGLCAGQFAVSNDFSEPLPAPAVPTRISVRAPNWINSSATIAVEGAPIIVVCTLTRAP